MNCLWVTWIDPWPEHDGQRIYTGRLIEALAAAGARVQVLAYGHDASHRRDGCAEGTVRWHLPPEEKDAAWRSVLSTLPHLAHRCATPSMRAGLDGMLDRENWDCIVFDGLSAGWALQACLGRYADRRDRPRLIYISHNHEESTRANVALNYSGSPIKKRLMHLDAAKAATLERRIVDEADMVTAITPEDAVKFTARTRQTPVIVLSPGYGGHKVERRHIGPGTPRRAVIVGSFDWIAKQMNLREFLSIADPLFAERGVKLQVVGGGNETFLDEMRRRYPGVDITGRVGDISPYFDNARVAIIPEHSGGGFKLKALDYVFHRTPVAALTGAVAGIPLKAGENILLFNRYKELAEGVLSVIDDFPYLSRLQESAYTTCSHAFDWRKRGRILRTAIDALEGRRDDAAA